MNVKFLIPFLFGSLFCNTVYGMEDCRRVTNEKDRLACFDEMYPTDTSVSAPEEDKTNTGVTSGTGAAVVESTKNESDPVAETITESVTINSTIVETNVVEVDESVTGETKVHTASDNSVAPTTSTSEGWSLFGRREQITISAIITDVMNRDRQKMVFQLNNGQIWLQTSPRDLPIRKGQEVTIKSGRIGGFILRTEGGTSTRVQLID